MVASSEPVAIGEAKGRNPGGQRNQKQTVIQINKVNKLELQLVNSANRWILK